MGGVRFGRSAAFVCERVRGLWKCCCVWCCCNVESGYLFVRRRCSLDFSANKYPNTVPSLEKSGEFATGKLQISVRNLTFRTENTSFEGIGGIDHLFVSIIGSEQVPSHRTQTRVREQATGRTSTRILRYYVMITDFRL